MLLTIGYVVTAIRSARGWRAIVAGPTSSLPSLSAIVPARDEERSIERSVRALLAQRHLSALQVIVVDDQSSDTTGDIVRRIAALDPRVTVIAGLPMPEGWVGKSWALHQGSRVARGPWLLFVDADTVVGPDAAAATIAYAIDDGLDVVSIVPKLETKTFWERAVMPSIFVMFPIAFGSPADLNDPTKVERAFLYGPYILMSRAAYDGVGGHAAVRGEMSEDMELAAALKKDGRYRSMLADGRTLASFRPYHSLREIWMGYTKNSFTGARGSAVRLLLGVCGAIAISAVPGIVAVRAVAQLRPLDGVEAVACVCVVIAMTARNLFKLGLPVRYALYQPIGLLVAAAIGLNSLAMVVSGRGVAWRGRRYTGEYRGTLP